MVVEEKCVFALQGSYFFLCHPNPVGATAEFRRVVNFTGGAPTSLSPLLVTLKLYPVTPRISIILCKSRLCFHGNKKKMALVLLPTTAW